MALGPEVSREGHHAMTIGLSLWLSLALFAACDENGKKVAVNTKSSGVSHGRSSSRTHFAPPAALTVSPSAQASKESEEPSERSAESAKQAPSVILLGKRRVVVDTLVDVAPAGPSAATSTGVLLLLKDGGAAVSPLGTGRTSNPRPVPTPLQSLDVAASDLVALEHGPAIYERFAYFIRQGRLVRRAWPSGGLEILATDARSYTRVAIAPGAPTGQPAVVGYIARHPTEKDTLVAKLWVEGMGTHLLTPDGSTGNSVAIARTGQGYVAVSLESRTGMSPLHARQVSLEGGKVKLGPDVVPWVAGTAQPLTEIHALGNDEQFWALLPIERDATQFGLARIDVGPLPQFGAEVRWRQYPNGLEPAVMATGRLCKKPVVLYARPATADPHSTQELHLSPIGDQGLGPSTVVASSRAFADASFAELDEGALVVYVADRRTWALRLRCVP